MCPSPTSANPTVRAPAFFVVPALRWVDRFDDAHRPKEDQAVGHRVLGRVSVVVAGVVARPARAADGGAPGRLAGPPRHRGTGRGTRREGHADEHAVQSRAPLGEFPRRRRAVAGDAGGADPRRQQPDLSHLQRLRERDAAPRGARPGAVPRAGDVHQADRRARRLHRGTRRLECTAGQRRRLPGNDVVARESPPR
mgnify:CR=1 FL=1